jgi:hypothetical protein
MYHQLLLATLSTAHNYEINVCCHSTLIEYPLLFSPSRARVKGGMRILGATASSDEWNVSVEKENPKHTVARVTAFRKDQDPDSTSRQQQDDGNGNK